MGNRTEELTTPLDASWLGEAESGPKALWTSGKPPATLSPEEQNKRRRFLDGIVPDYAAPLAEFIRLGWRGRVYRWQETASQIPNAPMGPYALGVAYYFSCDEG